MNDQQLLALIAAVFTAMKGERVADAMDKAEGILEELVSREAKHRMKHVAEPQLGVCYHCRMTDMMRKARTRETGIIQ